MIKEVYCFSKNFCASLLNENASIGRRGIIGAWDRRGDISYMLIIIPFHAKTCNVLMGCYV
jgi:hypothetical protein